MLQVVTFQKPVLVTVLLLVGLSMIGGHAVA
jgi:hypothetical protein